MTLLASTVQVCVYHTYVLESSACKTVEAISRLICIIAIGVPNDADILNCSVPAPANEFFKKGLM